MRSKRVDWPCSWLGVALVLVTATGSAAAADLRLVNAVKAQDAATVQALLKDAKVDVNATQGDGATALHWAAYWGDADTAARLVRAGAKVDAANALGVTALSLAAGNGNAPIVATLLEGGADPNLAQKNGKTPLLIASWTGNAAVVKLLLGRRADPKAIEPTTQQSALMWAISERHPDVARLLIEHGADVRARSKAGSTALIFATRINDLDTVKLLLEAGADVNEAVPNTRKDLTGTKFPAAEGRDAGANGASAVLVATIRGYLDLAKFLLDKGADPNAAAAGYTTLHWVSGTWDNFVSLGSGGLRPREEDEYRARVGLDGADKIEMVKALLAHGANPNIRISVPRYNTVDEDGVNALGADSIFRTRLNGATPFALAAAAGDVPVMKMLLAAGADPRIDTTEHTTPLMLAAGLGRNSDYTFMTESRALEAVGFLIDSGADVNAANDAGNTALHGAAHMRYEGLIQLLADKGAHVNVKNKDDQTPLMIAERLLQLYSNPVVEKRTRAGDLLRKLGAQ